MQMYFTNFIFQAAIVPPTKSSNLVPHEVYSLVSHEVSFLLAIFSSALALALFVVLLVLLARNKRSANPPHSGQEPDSQQIPVQSRDFGTENAKSERFEQTPGCHYEYVSANIPPRHPFPQQQETQLYENVNETSAYVEVY